MQFSAVTGMLLAEKCSRMAFNLNWSRSTGMHISSILNTHVHAVQQDAWGSAACCVDDVVSDVAHKRSARRRSNAGSGFLHVSVDG